MSDLLPIPSVHDPDAFRAALAPHRRRLHLARTFMEMDVAWSGQEAWVFRQLLIAMTDFLDGEAIDRLAAAKSRIDRALGEPDRDHAQDIRGKNGKGFAGLLANVLDILEQGSWPGHKSYFKKPGVVAFANILDDLQERCLVIAPRKIAELETMAEDLEKMRESPAP